jgi:hypothetical protein
VDTPSRTGLMLIQSFSPAILDSEKNFKIASLVAEKGNPKGVSLVTPEMPPKILLSIVRNFPCQTPKISKVSLVVMGS